MNSIVLKYARGLPAADAQALQELWERLENAFRVEDDARGVLPTYARTAHAFITQMESRRPVVDTAGAVSRNAK